jgi:hypothetical protein
MQSNKEEILSHLKKTVTKDGFVDLMVASDIIVGSDQLREQAMEGLIASKEELTLEDAGRIGLEVTYRVFVGRLRCDKCGTVCGVRSHLQEVPPYSLIVAYVQSKCNLIPFASQWSTVIT